jgi:hypothetical protein
MEPCGGRLFMAKKSIFLCRKRRSHVDGAIPDPCGCWDYLTDRSSQTSNETLRVQTELYSGMTSR